MKKYFLFCLISLFIVILFVLFNFVLFPHNYQKYVEKYSKEYGLDSAFVYSIIKAESNFDRNAKSKSGAIGLMQIMPTTARWVAGEFDEYFDELNLYNPQINIKYGCFYLNYLFNKFNDLKIVICAYNAGETVVRNWLDDNGNLIEEKISYGETRNYLKKVLEYYDVYKNTQDNM